MIRWNSVEAAGRFPASAAERARSSASCAATFFRWPVSINSHPPTATTAIAVTAYPISFRCFSTHAMKAGWSSASWAGAFTVDCAVEAISPFPGSGSGVEMPPGRLERPANGLGNRCSIQLSYGGQAVELKRALPDLKGGKPLDFIHYLNHLDLRDGSHRRAPPKLPLEPRQLLGRPFRRRLDPPVRKVPDPPGHPDPLRLPNCEEA